MIMESGGLCRHQRQEMWGGGWLKEAVSVGEQNGKEEEWNDDIVRTNSMSLCGLLLQGNLFSGFSGLR